MTDVADLRVKYSADTSDFDRGADKVNRGIKDFAKNAGAFAAGDLLAGGIRAIGSAAVGAAGSLAGMAMDAADLDSQISGIVALAGGGAEDFDQLSEAINSLAINPQLIVDSNQAADVIQNLIANGLTLKDVYGGAAEATVLLANATGGSFETSATVATDAMAIFNIQAEDMMAAVDGIARVTNSSKFDIEDYAYATSQGAAQVASAGLSFDDYNAILVATSNNFSGGSDAGTGIRNMFQKLNPTTNDAAQAMYEVGLMSTDYVTAAEHLGDVLGREVEPTQKGVVDAFMDMSKAQGINIKDTKKVAAAWSAFSEDFEVSAFYDEMGNLKSAAEIAGAFNTAFKDMNEQDKAIAINEMFGPDAARAVLAMADYSEEAFQTMIDGMNGTASASENARTRTNNLRGDMDVFGGTLDAIKLKIGKEFQPALRTLFQSGTGLLTELEPSITGIADALANGLMHATPYIVSATEGIVTAASTVLQHGFDDFFAVYETGESGIGQLAIALGADETAINNFGLALYKLRDAAQNGGLFYIYETGESAIGQFAIAMGANEEAVNSFGLTLYNLKGAFNEGGLKGLFDEAFKNVDIGASLTSLRTKIGEAFSALDFTGIALNLGGLTSALAASFANFDFSATVNTAKGQVNGLRDGLISGLSDTINNINWSTVSLSFSGIVDAISGKVAAIDWSTISWVDVGLKLVGVLAPGLGLAIKAAQWVISSDSFSGLVTSVQTALKNISWGDISASFTTLGMAISDAISKIDASGLSAIFDGFVGASANVDSTAAALGRLNAQMDSEGAGGSYFTKLKESLRQLDESASAFQQKYSGSMAIADFGAIDEQFNNFTGADNYFKKIGSYFANAEGWSFGTIDKQFNDFITGIPAKFASMKGSLGLFDFGAIDKSFNEFVANIPEKLAGIPDMLGFGETTPAWITSLQAWTWPDLTALTGWTWPTLPTWTWTAYPSWSWPAYLTFSWPSYTPWTWSAYPSWTWPSIPQPAWLGAMLSWNPAAAIANATNKATSDIANAFGLGAAKAPPAGTYNSPSTPSGGSYPAGNGARSLGLTPALAGAGGGGITININGYNQDEESLARRIAAIIQRRG